jgi:uncharacterized Ntn-hydrolase superfamily protein
MAFENLFSVGRPTGAALHYFVEIGKTLAGLSSKVDDDEDAGDKLEKICEVLKMTEREPKTCEHETDITKSCRSIIKRIYPDSKDRAKMLISTMDPAQLQAIQGE